MVGKTRPPTKPEDVVIYLKPPRRYEQIAVIESDSNGSSKFTGQGGMDSALARAKKEAARLGANGIIINTTGEAGGVTMASGNSSSMVGLSGSGAIKTVFGLAVYVTKE
jgi:hypothetical protein